VEETNWALSASIRCADVGGEAVGRLPVQTQRFQWNKGKPSRDCRTVRLQRRIQGYPNLISSLSSIGVVVYRSTGMVDLADWVRELL
jgi:hypothetical protein